MQRRNDAIFRALPFVMAMLLLPLVPMQSASALFSRAKEEPKAADGAPVFRWFRDALTNCGVTIYNTV